MAQETTLAKREQGLKKAALGDGEVFVKKTPQGVVKAVKGNITLEPHHMYIMKKFNAATKQWENTYQLTADAYYYLNRIAGVNITTPPYLFADGTERTNPYLIRNPKTGFTERIFVRKIAIGRSAIGNLVAIDQTIEFDPRQYLLEDLQKLSAKIKGAVEYELKPEKPTKKLFLPLLSDPLGDEILGLSLDFTFKEVQDVIATYQRRIKFIERIAGTMCERNVLKKHPALAVKQVYPDKNGKFIIPVFGWISDDSSLAEVNQKALKIAGGEEPQGYAVQREFERIETGDEVEANFEIEEDAPASVTIEPPKEPPPSKEQRHTLEDVAEPSEQPNKRAVKKNGKQKTWCERVHEGITVMDPKMWVELMQELGIDNDDVATMDEKGFEFLYKNIRDKMQRG